MGLEETKYLSQTSFDELHGSLIKHENTLNRLDTKLENEFSSKDSISSGRDMHKFNPRMGVSQESCKYC